MGKAWPDQDKVVILKRENDNYMVAHCGCLSELAFLEYFMRSHMQILSSYFKGRVACQN